MTSPVRIQRKRSKGWTLPPNTVCVGRPSKWGNPFFVRPYPPGKWEVFNEDELTEDPEPEPLLVGSFPSRDLAAREAVTLFRVALINGHLRVTVDDVSRELRGKNLACWCPIGSPCHADVLLVIANSEES